LSLPDVFADALALTLQACLRFLTFCFAKK